MFVTSKYVNLRKGQKILCTKDENADFDDLNKSLQFYFFYSHWKGIKTKQCDHEQKFMGDQNQII